MTASTFRFCLHRSRPFGGPLPPERIRLLKNFEPRFVNDPSSKLLRRSGIPVVRREAFVNSSFLSVRPPGEWPVFQFQR